MRPAFTAPLLTALLALLQGCAMLRTDKSQYAGMEQMLAQQQYPAAITQIEAAKETAYTYKDRVVYYLDLGMLHHWNGDYETSNELLEKAERAIEDNFTRSLSAAASSLLMNDNVLTYAGEDYEDIYLNVFKALNYLALGRNDEAFVEVRRIDLKLAQLARKYDRLARKLSEAEEAQAEFRPGKTYFQESALGRYLSMLLYRNDSKWDDVRIDLDKIERGWKLQPDIYTFPPPDFSRSTKHLRPPKARVNIIAFSGLAPDKKAVTFYIHTEENLIILAGSSENYLGKQQLDGFNVIPWEGIQAGHHFKIQLPYMHRRPARTTALKVEAVGHPAEALQPIESMENAAVETFGIRKPMIYLKTVTRAIVKGLAAEKAKQDMTENLGETMAFFTRLAADLAVDQTENADLRVSRFFPAEAAVRELHLDEGIYDFRIHYYDDNGRLLHTDEKNSVRIESGRLNVIESAYLH